MEKFNISRKSFIRNSALGLAGFTLLPNILTAKTDEFSEVNQDVSGNYTLKNVRLETGFIYEENEVVGTKTELFLFEISNGKIKSIKAKNPNANVTDA